MIGNRYELKRNEKELREIEKDLAEYLKVPFVRCSYDDVNSHKYKDKHEVEYRKRQKNLVCGACVTTLSTMRSTQH